MSPALAIALLCALLVAVSRLSTAWLDQQHPATIPAERRDRTASRR